GGRHLHVLGIREIDLAQILRVVRTISIQLTHKPGVDLHSCGPGRERFDLTHTANHGKGVLRVSRQIHEHPARVNQANAGANLHECNRSSLANVYGETVRQETNDGGGFDPGDLFQLLPAIVQRDKEDVASQVGAEDVHYLAARDIL